jgi:hypothetical protein
MSDTATDAPVSAERFTHKLFQHLLRSDEGHIEQSTLDAALVIVRAAMAAEREACAKIADAKFNPSNIFQTAVASAIADAIRNQ